MATDNKLRACADCQWFYRGDDGLTCCKPEYKKFDPVDGWVAQQARQVRGTGPCGPSGAGWEERVPLDYTGNRIVFALFLLALVGFLAKDYFG
jgi:hypothetical protein